MYQYVFIAAVLQCFLSIKATPDDPKVSYESINYPGFFLRGLPSGWMRIHPYKPGASQDYIQQASFVLVRGLADEDDDTLGSLQWLYKSNYYLTVSQPGKPVRITQDTGDKNFKKDATFKFRKGLSRPNEKDTDKGRYVSMESYSLPGNFIRHRENNFEVILDLNDGTDQFKDDATFWERPSIISF